jgi:hypothetical protein
MLSVKCAPAEMFGDQDRLIAVDQLLELVEMGSIECVGAPEGETHTMQAERVAASDCLEDGMHLATGTEEILSMQLKPGYCRTLAQHVLKVARA